MDTVGLQFHFLYEPEFQGMTFLEALQHTRRARPDLPLFKAVLATLGNTLIRWKHVELSLPAELLRDRQYAHAKYDECPPDARLCISAISVEGTIFRWKTLSNRRYQENLELRVGVEAAHAILAFADAHTGLPFAHGWYQSFFFPLPTDGSEFFCVQYVVMCAQAGGLLERLNPSATTGDVLLYILREHYGARYVLAPAVYSDGGGI